MSAVHGPLTEAILRDGQTLRRIGRFIYCLDETGSTNDDAFALAARDGIAADGAAFFAERQTAGRGRMGRRWVAPRGAAIHCSVLLCQIGGDAPPPQLALAAGAATCRAIAETTPVRPSLRWPNDVFVRGRKLAGVLVERRRITKRDCTAVVIGVGINCLQQAAHLERDDAITQPATSLEIESEHPVDRAATARALLVALDLALGHPSGFDVRAALLAWREWSDDIHTRVTVAAGDRRYTGRIVHVEPDAALLLELDDGRRVRLDPALTTVMARHGEG